MTTSELIAFCTEKVQRPFLVIGGYAVVAHGYARTTLDLDLLIRKTDREKWIENLREIGYEPRHVAEVFAQLVSSTGNIKLDLMFVNNATFDEMFAAAPERQFETISARIPALEHLIALKLHVLKQNLRHRILPDMDDVIHLVLANGVDVREPKWRQLFEKYGNLELYEKVRHATQP